VTHAALHRRAPIDAMTTAPTDSPDGIASRRWWEHPLLLAAVVFASAVPLLWPDVPPLVDLPGHMGRYRVQMEIANSPLLRSFYDFHWALIGNLGVDLLVVPLSKLFGIEMAVKIVIVAIPPLTVTGLLWVAREVHRRVPPTVFFALPLVYGYPFMFGFINFALAMALAMLAFALWLRLARKGRVLLRAALFVPISILIWVAHTFGWGTLGIMAFSAELVRQIDLKRSFFKAGLNTILHCLALAPPLVLMLLWRSGAHVGGITGEWFRWRLKWRWVLMVLRDRWYAFDETSLAILAAVLLLGLAWRAKLEYSRNLAASAIFLALVYICLPRIVFGSNYADMRLVPFVIAVAVIAIRSRPEWVGKAGTGLAAAGLLFFGARMAGNTISFWMYDKTYDRELAAVAHIPEGARVVSFVGVRCRKPWAMTRIEHLPAMALVRRRAFSNDQWSMSGAQLLTSHYPDQGWYSKDPSQQVLQARCPGERWLTLDDSLRFLPRGKFDYVWLIQPPVFDPALVAGMQPVWRSGTSVLYRIGQPLALPPPPLKDPA
jgi:hypothetical protein